MAGFDATIDRDRDREDDDENTSPGACACAACLAHERMRAALADACVERVSVIRTPATGVFDVYLERGTIVARGQGATEEAAFDGALEQLAQEATARMRIAGGS